jgi:hypothetical protein
LKAQPWTIVGGATAADRTDEACCDMPKCNVFVCPQYYELKDGAGSLTGWTQAQCCDGD